MEDWNNNTSSLNELTWVKETGQLRGHPPLIWGSFLTCLLVELLGITCPYPPPSLVSPSKASPGPIGVSLSTSWTKISRNKSVRSMSNYPTFKLIQNLPSSHYLPSFHPNPDHRHPSWDHWIGLLTAPPGPPHSIVCLHTAPAVACHVEGTPSPSSTPSLPKTCLMSCNGL